MTTAITRMQAPENTSEAGSRERPPGRRLLLVDDYAGVRTTMAQVLRQHGFDVAIAGNVPDALRLCCNQKFDVLLCDLHMPRPGDGFTVVSAMRHCNPQAVTIIYSGYPALGAAMSDILRQADEVLVKPLVIPRLIATINRRLAQARSREPRPIPGDDSVSVATVLQREMLSTIGDWLERVNGSPEIAKVALSNGERSAHLPQLFVDLTGRLLHSDPLAAPASDPAPARAHGEARRQQGYTAALVVEESRMLQVSIFKTLQSNLHLLDFSHLLMGVMTVADEVDLQLKETMASYLGGDKHPAKVRKARSAPTARSKSRQARPCPICGAAVGEGCELHSGSLRKESHGKRTAIVKEQTPSKRILQQQQAAIRD